MSYAIYCRLNLHVGASSREVVAATHGLLRRGSPDESAQPAASPAEPGMQLDRRTGIDHRTDWGSATRASTRHREQAAHPETRTRTCGNSRHPPDTGPQHAQHPAARGSAAMPQRPGTPRTDAEHANAPAALRPVPEVHPRREVADSLGRCRRCPPHAGSSASLQPSARVRVVDPRPVGLRRSSPTVRTGGRSPPRGVETLAAHRSTGRSPHMRVACPESAGTRPHPVRHVHQEPGRRHRSQPGSASRRSWPASTSRTWTAGWCVSCAAGATSSASSSAAMTERGNGRWTSSRPTCNFPMGFYDDEWEQVVQAHGVTSLDEYLGVSRVGRGSRLNRAARARA